MVRSDRLPPKVGVRKRIHSAGAGALFRRVLARCILTCFALGGLAFLPPALKVQSTSAVVSPAIQANTNRTPAGKLENGILTLHLEMREGEWYPEAETGPSLKVYAFAEEGQAPQVPGPLLRVPEGTEVRVRLRNLLPSAAIVHGLHEHPGTASDTVKLAPGEERALHFVAGSAGTYQYWASTALDLDRTRHGRPYREDSQLAGAFVVDAPGAIVADRIFVLGVWRNDVSKPLSQYVPVVNGKSWPYTERLTYNAGDNVHWRLINASDSPHPMHMHGSYYRVESVGDGERDQIFPPDQQRLVVTHVVDSGETMTMHWVPPVGKWIFHCHFLIHTSPEMTVADGLAAQRKNIPENDADHPEMDHVAGNHMVGMVLGITVSGARPPAAARVAPRKLRLLVKERPAHGAMASGFGYQLEEGGRLAPAEPSAPGPPFVLERGKPVEITVVNQLRQSTSVHWHGMELESYYDGVPGWGANGQELTPVIRPGESFVVRFTPPRAGTFMYHTHLNDEAQISGGLYGPLVVIEPGTKFDASSDFIFVVSRGGRKGLEGPLFVNGAVALPPLHWKAGQRYRLRLIDISNSNNGDFSLLGADGLLQWRAIAKDGAELPSSQAVMKDAMQTVAAGEIYDFEYAPREPCSLRLEVTNPGLKSKVVQPIEVQ
jgi:manganese oxidase